MADNNFVETVTITLEHYDRLQRSLGNAEVKLKQQKDTIEGLLEMFDMTELSESTFRFDTVDKKYNRDFINNKTVVRIEFEVDGLIK